MTKFLATTTSADAPDVESGIYDATFLGVLPKAIQSDFSSIEKDKDGNEIPNSYEWRYGLLDEEFDQLYKDDGDPLEVTKLTSMNLNTTSKTVPGAVKVLKAMLTTAEYDAFLNGEAPDSDDLIGRKVQVDVQDNARGWPTIEAVLPARKQRRSK